MALDREGQRHDHRAVLDRDRLLDHAAVDLAERDRAVRRVEQRLRALDGARVTLAGDGGEGVERELPELGELPAGLALELRQAETVPQGDGALSARRQPGGLSD